MMLRLTCLDRLFVDALLTDGNNQLLFLSAWAKDTVAQEFLAKLSLSSSEDGFLGSVLTFIGESTIRVGISRDASLDKRQGRVSGTVFGDSIVNIWVFSPICVVPDSANARAVLLYRVDDDTDSDRLWSIIRAISTAPVLDHWRETIIRSFKENEWITELAGFGVSGLELDLSNASNAIGDLVRSGELTADPHTIGETLSDERVAA